MGDVALVGTTGAGRRPGIVLETSRRQVIANDRGIAPSNMDRAGFQTLLDNHRDWVRRRDPTGEYNCAGLVWASRRTNIYDDPEWQKIIDDDQYSVVELPTVQPGDLAVYWDEDAHAFLHVGLVLEFRLRARGSDIDRVPWILSKLSPAFGEVIHAYDDVPYAKHGFKHGVKFMTDRT